MIKIDHQFISLIIYIENALYKYEIIIIIIIIHLPVPGTRDKNDILRRGDIVFINLLALTFI